MKNVTRRIIAWTGLAFMIAFTALMVTSFFNAELLWGRIVYVALACLIVGLVLFAVIYFDNKARKERELAEEEEKNRKSENKRKREQNSAKIAAENKKAADKAQEKDESERVGEQNASENGQGEQAD